MPDTTDPLERVTAELYALRPEAFVAARDDLARRLRAQGDRATAAKVKRLRRPTLSVWAANRLPRADPDGVRGLAEVGASLEAAQRDAVGGDVAAARQLRQLTTTARRLTDELVEAAARLLVEDGYQAGDPVRRRLAATLRAATATPAGRAALLGGQLTHDLDPTGFGDLTGLPAAAGEAAPARPPSPAGPRPAAAPRDAATAPQAAARREAARRVLDLARQREQAAADRAAGSQQVAERARTTAQNAQAHASRLRQAAAGLRQAADELAERARAAEDAATQTETDAEELAGEAALATRQADEAAAELERARTARRAAETQHPQPPRHPPDQ